MRIALVFNPALPGTRLARIAALASVLEARGHSLSRHDSAAFDPAAAAPPADLVCICGGDGTVRLVLERQYDPAELPPLAIFPTGTINLLARELGYPADPHAFSDRIEYADGQRAVRLAQAGGRWFVACASVGIDAIAVGGVSLALKARIGRLAYVAALLALLWRWPRPALTVTVGDERIAAEAVFVLRGGFYAGPWTLDRRASLASDQLHVLALPRARRLDLLALAWFGLTGARHLRSGWRQLAADSVEIGANGPLPLQLDGDIAGTAPVNIAMTETMIRWR